MNNFLYLFSKPYRSICGLVAILLIIGPAAPALCGVSSETGNYLFAEDWDSGTPPNGGAWPSDRSATWNGWKPSDYGCGPSGSIVTGIAHSGNRSLKKVTDSNDCIVDLMHPISPAQSALYIRFYLYLGPGSATKIMNNPWGSHLLFLNTASTAEIALDFRPCTDSNYKNCNGLFIAPHSYDPEVWFAETQGGTPFDWTKNEQKWVLVEWFVDLAGNKTKLWINEQLRVDANVTWNASSASSFFISGFTPKNSGGVEYYFDDIVVSKSYIGPRGGGATAPPPSSGDSTPPQVSNITPANNSVNVADNAEISFNVTDSGVGVSRSSIVMKVNGTTVTPSISGDSSNYAVRYTPSSKYPAGSAVTVTVNAQDSNSPANVMPTRTFGFTVAEVIDSSAPFVTDMDPANNAVGISTTAPISLHLKDNGEGVDRNTISMKVNGATVTPTITGTPADYTLSYRPAQAFPAGTPVTVSIGAKDLNVPANTMATQNYTFTTAFTSGALTTQIFGNSSNATKTNTIQDTYINVNTVNYANDSQTLNTYTWPTNTVANRILMKFDLSSIPQTAVVQEATLYLYMYDTEGDGGKTNYSITAHKVVGVNPVISACNWDTYDGSRGWTGGANGGAQNMATAESSNVLDKTAGYKSWTVSKMVQDWVQTPGTNFGLILNSDSNAAADSNRLFRPSEFAESNQRPYLVVKYATSGPGDSNPEMPGTPPNPRIVN